MRRAFELAGARAVIASLWAVEDDATREWMNELYRARAQGTTGAADAIRLADRRVLEARRRRGQTTHPFYWAAFTGTGR
jgi:CHAT domain-containing protein